MRRRVFTAAMTMLMGGAGLMVSASAQSISTDTLSATQVPAELEEGAPLALGSGSFGAGGFSLFPRASEWNAGTNAFASTDEGVFLGGHYARVPAYGLLPAANLAEDNVELRDLSMSARILPGLQLDFAKWNYSSELGFGDSRAAGVIENSVVTGTGLRSPYSSFGNTGSYVGATLALTNNVDFHFGQASASLTGPLDVASPMPRDLALQMRSGAHTIETTSVGLDWNVTDWAGVGVTASQTRETGSVLGAAAMPISSSAGVGAETAALGISARVGFGEGWVTTVAYNEAVTQLHINAGALAAIDSLRSQTYGFSLSKQGVFGDDAVGFSVSRPLQTFGSTNFASLSLTNVLNRRPDTLAAPESDFELGYVTTYLDGALALQANAAYQVNANGEQGQDAVSVLSRAKIRF